MTRAEYLRSYRAAHAAHNRAYRARLKQYPRAHARHIAALHAATQQWRDNNRAVVRILTRMRKRGKPVTADEAREIIREYGADYPMHRALTHAGKLWVRREKARGVPHVEAVFEAWETPEFRGNVVSA